MSMSIDQLINGINPKSKMPRGFQLYSEAQQIAWMKSNQRCASAFTNVGDVCQAMGVEASRTEKAAEALRQSFYANGQRPYISVLNGGWIAYDGNRYRAREALEMAQRWFARAAMAKVQGGAQ